MELLVGMMTRHENLLAREKELNKEIEHLTLTLLEAIDFEEDYEWIKSTANRLEQEMMDLHINRQCLHEIEVEMEKIGNFITDCFNNLDKSEQELIKKDILGNKL
jgi:hypothetical protein